MNRRIYFTIIAIVASFFAGCELPELQAPSDFSVVSLQKTQDMFGKANITLQVRNNTQQTLTCKANIKFMRGEIVVEKTFELFVAMQPGEIEQDETTSFNIYSQSDYDRIIVELEWRDAAGNEKTKEFVYY